MVYYFLCTFFVFEEEKIMNTKTWVITVGGEVCAPLLLGDFDSKTKEDDIKTEEKSKEH